MLDLDYSHWDAQEYMLRQDEISGIVEVLNSINTGISGATLVVPDTYSFFSTQLSMLDWAKTDDLPVATSGKVSH